MDDLERVREQFQLKQVAVLGHSWGGLLAMEYAIRHPERVSHLILLNTCPASCEDFAVFRQQRLAAKDPEDAERMRVLDADPRMAEGDPDITAAATRLSFKQTLRSPELLDRLIAHLQLGWTRETVLTAQESASRLQDESVNQPGYDLLPALAQLRIPTLILHGDYDFIPLSCVTHIAEAIPGAHLIVVPDCGHFSYLERPDAVRNVLSAFFQAG
jgi:proline iminopeptidase